MIPCHHCKKDLFHKSNTDNKYRLRAKIVVFSEDLTKSMCVCTYCNSENTIPLELGKSIKEELLYIKKDT